MNDERSLHQIVPPFKWAGGKRWLVQQYRNFFPKSYNNFIEPFFGGGSVFFALQPRKAVVSDINRDLIEAYICIRDYWGELEELLELYHDHHSEEFFYQVRASKPRSLLRRAARFIYLNRTCWNGLYRVNKRGEFNVPVGTKSNVILDSDDFEAVSAALKNASISCCDFADTIKKASPGDFLFIDPPYTVNHNKNGFLKYNESIFSWEDQERLRRLVKSAIDRQVKVLITNAAHESVFELYHGIGKLHVVQRESVISGANKGRGSFGEAIIQCY